MRDHLLILVNGQPCEIHGADATLTLSSFLRQRKRWTGTKIVCNEGDCGACSVLVGRPQSDGEYSYTSVDACILFMHQLDGAHVITIEGLAAEGKLHPVQQAMVDCFGSQCGFCTPGFVNAMVAAESRVGCQSGTSAGISRDDWRLALTGNLCRCTGYEQILEAAESAATRCPSLETLYPSQRLRALSKAAKADQSIRLNWETDGEVFAPDTLESALEFRRSHPDCRIVNGATDVGVLVNKGRIDPSVWLSLANVVEQDKIQQTADLVKFGMRTTWADVENWSRDAFAEFYNIVIRFGSPQIRNVGTFVGNIANGSPIADSLPLLMVMEAELELRSVQATRRVPIVDFYQGYKQMDMRPDELLTGVSMPLPTPDANLKLYKVSKRNDMDISTFTAAIYLELNGDEISQARIAYGGVGPTVVRLRQTESLLTGQPFTLKTMEQAGKSARSEIQPISDVRGSEGYRLQLAENILLKFWHEQSLISK